ncbi:glycoside hydrolase family 79 protein [Hypholoma sublateritium FD-334 SS-4]|uniref:Glycoside hydrolase family 79 protein n=1 Tax=Hypholoma sublateritium (strain FD-334 SS-4) TaxID=945553 RepID=A0A0D2P885_HYPSF|nr:glycoside hydrolase family 79 protein [Hypholoma sublateritium FD-334 SS-4]
MRPQPPKWRYFPVRLGTAFPSIFFLLPLLAFLQIPPSTAQITVYYVEGQRPLASSTATAASTNYSGSAAYNPTVLLAPPPPGAAAMPTSFGIDLVTSVPQGASILQSGNFFGFSIEMSVVNQVLGKNSSLLQVPFLNLMANIQQRSGGVVVRVGGNTQETASLVESTSDGRILEKDLKGSTNPTQTPPLIFTPDLLHMLRAISSLVNVHWHLGIPFNDTTNLRLAIAERGQAILGDYLMGLQVGNEPDLYADHGHRPMGYGPYDYFGEFSTLVQAIENDTNIPNKGLLIGPNLATGDWTPEMVWNTGFVDAYSANLGYLAVEHYPTDNCFAQFGIGTPRDPQETFPNFLNHTAGQALIAPYLNSTAYAQTKGKKLLMFETNTASCGGFVGISDSFGAALWGLDYAMQMAHSNFSGAYFHVGGQNVYYNPFTPPPTNQSSYKQWTVGPIYYSALVMAETIGPSNATQVLDVQANANNIFTPAYAVYEHGTLVRALLINYASDPSGASDIYVSLSAVVGGTPLPSSVQVKYLLAASVAQKGNYTWAGQTFGSNFASDGRPAGMESVQTVACSSAAGTSVCTVRVPAPGAALVFLTPGALTETAGAASRTFATTAATRTENAVSIDPAVLATSNGHSGMGRVLGSTSHGSENGAVGNAGIVPSGLLGALLGVALGAVMGWEGSGMVLDFCLSLYT